MRLQKSKKLIVSAFLFSFALFSACCVHHNPFFGSHTLRKVKKSVVKINGLTTVKFTKTSSNSISRASLELRTSASGAIVKHYKDLTIILTAAHVCGLMYGQQLAMIKSFINPGEKLISLDINTKLQIFEIEGRSFDAIQIYAQRRTDTCVIATNKIPQNALDIADKEAEIGEEVFNIGLPHGIWAPNFIPMFDGRYLGPFNFTFGNRSEISCYSVPAAPGQSGSPILNSHGQVVGMIHSVYRRYNHLSLSSTLKQIKSVVDFGTKQVENDYKKYKKSLDI